MFKYPWQEAVVEAACELDPLDLHAKLAKAETVVRERMAALCEDGRGLEERQALLDALDALRIIGRDFVSGST